MTALRFSTLTITIGMLLGLLAVPMAQAVEEQRVLLSGDITVTEQDLQQELLLLNGSERSQTLAGPGPLKEFIRQIYLSKRLAAEAERMGLEQQAVVQARLTAQRRWALSQALREHLEKQIQQPDFTALARQDYAVHHDKFQLPEQFKAAHILKKVNCDCERDAQRQKIEQILARLQAGQDFATLAKAESEEAASAAKGGDLGEWLKREQLVPPFADALAKLKVGQISDVVETQYGFHIIKLLDHQPAHAQTFEEAQPALEQELRNNYVKEQLYQQGQAYLPGANAKYDEAAIEALLHSQENSTRQSAP